MSSGARDVQHRGSSRDRRGRSLSPSIGHKGSHSSHRERRDDEVKHSRPRRYLSRSPHRRSQSRSHSRRRRKESHREHSHLRSRSMSRSRSRSPKSAHDDRGRHKRRRSPSPSLSRSRSVSSEDSEYERRKSKKSERHKRRSSRSRERKKRKKEKKGKKKKGAVTSQWGQYGTISETDLYNKEAEFRAWLVEECKVNPETLTKIETKKRFQSFVEDYNTATLPHEKFYNMNRYEAHMALLRNGELVPQGDEDTYDLNADMQAHSNAHKRNTVEHESYLTKEQLTHLRRVQHERIEISKRKQLGLEVKQNMGVRMDGSMFDD